MVYYVKNTNIFHNYWYFDMATCFGLSLDNLQANVLDEEVQSVRTMYCGIPYNIARTVCTYYLRRLT
jgi:hypothetical protein